MTNLLIADDNDVMREQLEVLIEHINEHHRHDCTECQRYLRARDILLELFAEASPLPPKPNVMAATA